MKNSKIYKLILSAMFLSLGIILPQFINRIPEIGRTLLPMHIPVLLCGLICGLQYGLVVGALVPILCSLIFTMPPMYPVAISMSFELATYGLVAGLIYMLLNNRVKSYILKVYISLIGAMVAGRIVMGIANTLLLSNGKYGFNVFINAAFITALPGIIVQLIIIPTILIALKRNKLIR